MYQIIENPIRMTYDEMWDNYDEKWLFLVNCEFNQYSRLLSGIPVIAADRAFEGVPEGIYEQFKEKRYAPKGDVTFISEPIMFGSLKAYPIRNKRNASA
jgi:hypothetical protein